MEDSVEAAEEACGIHARVTDEERLARSHSAKCQQNSVMMMMHSLARALLGGGLGLEEEGGHVLDAGAHLDHIGNALGLLRRDEIHNERRQITLSVCVNLATRIKETSH